MHRVGCRGYPTLVVAGRSTNRVWLLASQRGKRRTLNAFIAAYRALNYHPCSDPDLETGFEKIALYVDLIGVPTHAARQLANGLWTSKLGDFEDIEHKTLDCLNGQLYGSPLVYLKRRVKPDS
ncbi:MAG: hypothetical protein ACLQOO_25320 [Terriglobia bacterium]